MTLTEFQNKYKHISQKEILLRGERHEELVRNEFKYNGAKKLHHCSATERTLVLYFLEWAAAYWSLIDYD